MKEQTIKQEIQSSLLSKVKNLLPKHLHISYESWREDFLRELDKLNYKK